MEEIIGDSREIYIESLEGREFSEVYKKAEFLARQDLIKNSQSLENSCIKLGEITESIICNPLTKGFGFEIILTRKIST